MTANKKSKRGLASLSPERRRQIASQGGKAAPYNFKNNPDWARKMSHRAAQARWGKKEDDTRQ